MRKSTNGAHALELTELAPGFHPEPGVFITPNGTALTLLKTNPLLIERIVNTQQGKPDVPVVEVKAPGGRTRQERNPNDPDFKKAVASWEREKQMRLMVYLFSQGVEENPPEQFIIDTAEVLPGETDAMYKYLWVGALFNGEIDSDDAAALTTAIMGRVYPTAEGLEEAAAVFPSTG